MKLYLVIGALLPLIQRTLRSSRFDFVTKSRAESRPILFFVAVKAVNGRDGAEESVLFAVNAGGEKQCVGWSSPVFRGSGVAIVAEGEGPQAIDG